MSILNKNWKKCRIGVLIKLLKQQKQTSIPKNYSPHVYTNTNIQNLDDNRDTYSQFIENTLTTESCKIQNKSNIEEHKTLRTTQTNTLLDESKRAVDHVTKWLEQQVKGKLRKCLAYKIFMFVDY